jgi:hypothetical protein
MNKFGRVLASVGVAGSLALGSGVVAATAAPTYQYYTVTVEASSSYAVAGGAVHITARGFLPGETLFVSFYGGAQPGWHEVADDNGEFEGSFTLPA